MTNKQPDKQPDKRLIEFLAEEEYYSIRALPNGVIIGLYDFIFTVGLCYGLDRFGYAGRYCYEKKDKAEAIKIAAKWNGLTAPPGPWVAHK